MRRTHRYAVLWGLLAVLAAATGALAALGDRASHGSSPATSSAPSAPAPAAPGSAEPSRAAVAAARRAARRTVRRRSAQRRSMVRKRRKAARKRRRAKILSGTPMRKALGRAYLRKQITEAQYKRWRSDLFVARSAARRLAGTRGRELRAVVSTLENLAAGGRMTVSRLPLAMLTLRRNSTVWRYRPMPRPSQRMLFGRDPAVFQYFPGRGVQFHPLATAGRANAIAAPCLSAAKGRRSRATRRLQARTSRVRRADRRRIRDLRAKRGRKCYPNRLKRRLDRLVTLSSNRGGFASWEYLFNYGGGRAPWVSGMTQATAAQALARGSDALGDSRYREAAVSALGAFEVPPPVGIALRSGGDRREYLMYSFSPGLKIINGFLQAVIGLHDVAELTGSRRAKRLFAAGDRKARAELPAYDTGAWSRYSLHGRESTLSYHQLVTRFLVRLCERTGRDTYCTRADRFERYQREPPRISLDAPRGVMEGRPAAVRFWLSKVSSVRVTVTNARGTVMQRSARLPRGSYSYAWTPPRPGAYTIRVSAVGPEGRRGTSRSSLTAKAKPKPKKKPKPKRKGKRGPKRDAPADRAGRKQARDRAEPAEPADPAATAEPSATAAPSAAAAP